MKVPDNIDEIFQNSFENNSIKFKEEYWNSFLEKNGSKIAAKSAKRKLWLWPIILATAGLGMLTRADQFGLTLIDAAPKGSQEIPVVVEQPNSKAGSEIEDPSQITTSSSPEDGPQVAPVVSERDEEQESSAALIQDYLSQDQNTIVSSKNIPAINKAAGATKDEERAEEYLALVRPKDLPPLMKTVSGQIFGPSSIHGHRPSAGLKRYRPYVVIGIPLSINSGGAEGSTQLNSIPQIGVGLDYSLNSKFDLSLQANYALRSGFSQGFTSQQNGYYLDAYNIDYHYQLNNYQSLDVRLGAAYRLGSRLRLGLFGSYSALLSYDGEVSRRLGANGGFEPQTQEYDPGMNPYYLSAGIHLDYLLSRDLVIGLSYLQGLTPIHNNDFSTAALKAREATVVLKYYLP